MRTIIWISLTMLAIGGAAAEDQPLTFPTRDVVVQTTNHIGGISQVTQTFYLVSEQKSRSVTKGYNMYTLLDQKTHTAIMVYPGSPPTYVVHPLRDYERGKYVRTEQTERIAGYECLVWRRPPEIYKMPAAGYPGQAPNVSRTSTHCITADGVVLKSIIDQEFQGHQSRVISEATHVKYGALDPAMFRTPPGAIRK